MKLERFLATLVMAPSLLCSALILPAIAGQPSFGNAINGLFSPTNADRFFREGQRQFEQEIFDLRKFKHTQPSDLLLINSSIFEQPQDLQQQEQQFWDNVTAPD